MCDENNLKSHMTLMFIENGNTITTHLYEGYMLEMVQNIVMTVQL